MKYYRVFALVHGNRAEEKICRSNLYRAAVYGGTPTCRPTIGNQQPAIPSSAITELKRVGEISHEFDARWRQRFSCSCPIFTGRIGIGLASIRRMHYVVCRMQDQGWNTKRVTYLRISCESCLIRRKPDRVLRKPNPSRSNRKLIQNRIRHIWLKELIHHSGIICKHGLLGSYVPVVVVRTSEIVPRKQVAGKPIGS